jgi:chemotaxis protein CheY-P-specific phosphatase CheC
MSSEKVKKKLDKILEFVQERLGEEVGGLMGAKLVMSNLQTQMISKEDFFDEPYGKMVLSEMELSGEIEGNGGLLISVKDAIRLGGTLIMLPENELVEAVTSEDYSEEIDDSYGELANLIAGAYTSTFEEMFPKSFRFIRKTSTVISPMKVEVDSDQPIPNQLYYKVSSSMKLNDTELGELILLVPAESFGLVETPAQGEPEQNTEADKITEASAEGGSAEGGSGVTADAEQAQPQGTPFDIEKQKKRVDACLAECRVSMEEEVGALLGTEIKLSDHTTTIITKEDYFMDEAAGKLVLAHMDIVGELDGKSYLAVSLKDAIRIGGTLIMLPPDELDNVVGEGDFSDDSEDAYGEIANIISGVYTKVFEEQYPDKIRFVKTHLEEVISMKVDTESDDPMPDVLYYMATSAINMGGKDLGKMQMLIPASAFKLEALAQTETADDAEEASRVKGNVTGAAANVEGERGSGSVGGAVGSGGAAERAGAVTSTDGAQNPEFLLVSNDGNECSKITEIFNQRGIAYRVLDYKDNVSNYLPGDVRAVFLLMSSVDEKGLGVAIKISAASSLPLVAAGPEWTRTKVIKAVKYGVDDILLTPASDNDIIEKIDSLLTQKAA